MSNLMNLRLVKTAGVLGVVLALAAQGAHAQQARYRGPSSIPPWKMDMQITPVKGVEDVTTQVYDGNAGPYDGFGGTFNLASMMLNPDNFINWTLPGGLVGSSPVTGTLVGGALGAPASSLQVTAANMPVTVTGYGSGFATETFVLAPLLPQTGGVASSGGTGAPPTPAAPKLFTGTGSYGYMRVAVNLVFDPSGQWAGQVVVMRVQPSPGNPAGVRLPDTILNVTQVLNLNQGPIVKLALTPTQPLPFVPNYPNIAPQSPECDVSFVSSGHIICNVLQIPAVGIFSFFVDAR